MAGPAPVVFVHAPRSPLSPPPAAVELAVPRTFDARYGSGIDRGLCLGGGGLFFVAWQAAYLRTLASHGIRFDNSERVVGTSAGSMVASALAAGKLNRLHSEIVRRVQAAGPGLGPGPGLRNCTRASSGRSTSSSRPPTASPATVQEIGHAALAAATPSADGHAAQHRAGARDRPLDLRRTAHHLRRRLHRRAVRGDP